MTNQAGRLCAAPRSKRRTNHSQTEIMIATCRRSIGVLSKLRHGEDFKKIPAHGAAKRVRLGQGQALLRAWADDSLDRLNQVAIEEKIAEKSHPHNLSTQLAWISRMKR